MSGIVGSRFNIRSSGLVGSLGTDGQVFTSSGAGAGAVFEAAAGGGKILKSYSDTVTGTVSSDSAAYVDTGLEIAVDAPASSGSIFLCMWTHAAHANAYGGNFGGAAALERAITDGATTTLEGDAWYVNSTDSGDWMTWQSDYAILDTPSTASVITYKVKFRESSSIENTSATKFLHTQMNDGSASDISARLQILELEAN